MIDMLTVAHQACGIEPVESLRDRLERNWRAVQAMTRACERARTHYEATGEEHYRQSMIGHQRALCRLSYEFGQLIEEVGQ